MARRSSKKTRKQNGGKNSKKMTKKERDLTPKELEYFKSQPQHRRKRLLEDPCFPSTESPGCVKLMVKDNPWMLEEGGDKYVKGVVGKKSLLHKEIKKKKYKKNKSGAKKQSKITKYDKYDKCLEECELKKKNNKHVCTEKCKGYKNYEENFKKNPKIKSKSKQSKKQSKITKYDKCLEECELKKKNSKHVCSMKCKKYKDIDDEVLNSKIKSKSKQSKKQEQKGGCIPCAAPAIPPIVAGLGAVGAGALASFRSVSSSFSQSGDNIKREQQFEKIVLKKNKNKKKETFHITQDNNKVTSQKNKGKKKVKTFETKNMKQNIKKATEYYDKKIEYCVVKGYKKC